MINRLNRTILYLCLIAVGLVCAVTSSADDVPDGGAIYDYKKWHCDIKGNDYTLSATGKITIYNPKGEEYNSISLSETKFSTLKNVKIRVLDADDKLLYKRNRKDMSKACGYARYALYADICTFYIELDAPKFPYSIEYEYVIEYNSLFSWRAAIFQSNIPVEYASYTLTYPSDFSFRHKLYNLDITPQSFREGSTESLIWEASNIAAMDNVDYLPPGSRRYAQIRFAANRYRLEKYDLAGEDWSAISDWYRQLYHDRFLPAENTVAPVTEGGRDLMESIYDDIIDRIRYVAIEDGIGGWQPYKAEVTDKREFGDCKDMSTLLISKLRNSGVEAWPVHVLTRNAGPLDIDFPSVSFNHVITVATAGADTVWMDPTCNDCPFGELPLMDEDIEVLVDTRDGGQIWRTPASTPDENRSITTAEAFIGADRKVIYKTTYAVTGNNAVRNRGRLKMSDEDETRQYVAYIFPGGEKKYTVRKSWVENLGQIDKPLLIKINALSRKPVDKLGKTIYFNPYIFSGLSDAEQERLEDREYPLNLSYPRLMEDVVVITWDSTLGIDSIALPPNDSMHTDFGSLYYTAARVADTVTIRCLKRYDQYFVDTTQFAQFEEFRGKVKKLNDQYVKMVVGSTD